MLLDRINEAVRDALCQIADYGRFRKYVGEYGEQLASQLQNRMRLEESLLFCSGTTALEMVLRAAGIGAEDEVMLSAYDYPGNFWAVTRVGAQPVLVDIEPNSWRISIAQVEASLIADHRNACKAVVVSHVHGELQPVNRLREICDAHGVLFIEDCCQVLGALIDEQPVGSSGHAAIVSFGGGKVLSAGRGGALLTSNPQLAQKARIVAGAGSGPYWMSEMQAAVVLAQLPWLDQINECCRSYFAELNRHLTEQTARVEIESIMPSESMLADTSYYQAGWIIRGRMTDRSGERRAEAEQGQIQEEIIRSLHCHGIPGGKGFDGFHRRSPRRCRIPNRLMNVPRVVAETVVVHHYVALESRTSPHEVAAVILAGIREAGPHSS